MQKIRILFLIHDLGQGGAEKVLVNLVNHLDRAKFDITVMSLFGGGVNEQFLDPSVKYLSVFKRTIPANTKIMKLLSPKRLHHLFIKEHYDIEISYLQGPSARIISGCDSQTTKLINWVHIEQHTRKEAAYSFRNEREAEWCYGRFDNHVFVAETVKQDFLSLFSQKKPCLVLYNTVESECILQQANEPAEEILDNECTKLIAIGSLKESKGFDRLLKIVKRLKSQSYQIHLYILGKGPQKNQLLEYVQNNDLGDTTTFLGYQTNPYKYLSKCDLFVCSSHREGFSTAATESLIVGTPVCTVSVSGMTEMLGSNNDYGIVTENSEEALYEGIKNLLDYPDLLSYYKKQAETRGKSFITEKTVKAVEDFLLSLQ